MREEFVVRRWRRMLLCFRLLWAALIMPALSVIFFAIYTIGSFRFKKIEAELMRVKACGGNPHKIFLGDGRAFSLQTEKLLTILDSIHAFQMTSKFIPTQA